MQPWVWGAIIIPVALALISVIWFLFRAKVERAEKAIDDHVKEDVKAHERIAVLESKAERTDKDIGNHETGIRGELHEHAQTLTHHEVRITMLEKK